MPSVGRTVAERSKQLSIARAVVRWTLPIWICTMGLWAVLPVPKLVFHSLAAEWAVALLIFLPIVVAVYLQTRFQWGYILCPSCSAPFVHPERRNLGIPKQCWNCQHELGRSDV